LLGHIAGSKEEFSAQASFIRRGWAIYDSAAVNERDAWVGATLLRNLSPLVWDLHLVDHVDFLREALERVDWSPETADHRWVVHRALAWTDALDGDHIGAFSQFRECIDLAPSVPRRIESMLDRAYLASELGQSVIQQEEMLSVQKLADCVEWESLSGESGKVLLWLAEAYARTDAAVARRYLDMYDPTRLFPKHLLLLATSDRRQMAMECDAQAAVVAAEGRAERAVALRKSALAVWSTIEHGWRAARSAVGIADLTRAPEDVRVAREHCEAYRRSWLGRRARRFRNRKAA
jgi:hypothetical protein